MPTAARTIVDLETRFWRSMVDQDTDTAVGLLAEPSLMVGAHGAMKFDHAAYRKMAEKGAMIVTDFQMSDVDVVFPNDATAILSYHVKQVVAARADDKRMTQEMHDTSTWIKSDKGWQCVMHTETPVEPAAH